MKKKLTPKAREAKISTLAYGCDQRLEQSRKIITKEVKEIEEQLKTAKAVAKFLHQLQPASIPFVANYVDEFDGGVDEVFKNYVHTKITNYIEDANRERENPTNAVHLRDAATNELHMWMDAQRGLKGRIL